MGGNSYILWEQCSLLSDKGWASWWDPPGSPGPTMEPTPYVRGGSMAPKAPKFFSVMGGRDNVWLRSKDNLTDFGEEGDKESEVGVRYMRRPLHA